MNQFIELLIEIIIICKGTRKIATVSLILVLLFSSNPLIDTEKVDQEDIDEVKYCIKV